MKESNRKLLNILAKYFEQDTWFLSSVERDHPYYKAIVAFGKQRQDEVVHWLLERVENNWHWPMALHEIVGINSPSIREEDAGRIDVISAQWKYWGKLKGYLDT